MTWSHNPTKCMKEAPRFLKNVEALFDVISAMRLTRGLRLKGR